MIDVQTTKRLESNGYRNIRKLPDGRIAATCKFMYTTALVVGIDETGYSHRYCYEFDSDAGAALAGWDGIGDPPGPWIKVKGMAVERLGPGAIEMVE